MFWCVATPLSTEQYPYCVVLWGDRTPSSSDLARGSQANDVMQGDVGALVTLGKPNIQYDKLYLMLSVYSVSKR